MKRSKRWTATSEEFMTKVCRTSGLGDDTYYPAEVATLTECDTLKTTYRGARAETEMVLFSSVAKLLTGLKLAPQQIDAVIVNCSSFNPVPSLAACVINHFHMRPGVKAYTLSGMGCAASIVAVELAQELLQNHRNMRVLICSTENITSSLYYGAEKSMLLTNCLFRLGGAAAVLSNCRKDKPIAKYSQEHIVRTHLSGDDAYNAVISHEDDNGHVGIKIGRDVMHVAGRALTMNITALAPLILPISEKVLYVLDGIARKVSKSKGPRYVPDFKTAVEHFAIHPGGKAVIDVVEKALSLQPRHALPNRAAFERFGNTSSSSTWYAWSHIETFGGVKRGDRLWQLAFGSGFKCNSAIWRALKPNNDQHDAWTGTPSC
ncbi:hypothetical protein WJX73_009276 [Symbiochloris irregularis]|uniref:very-long-chain 3-oxoacyl-CoA synthase n=1 Tax=Symbiochloris irregularis TaxID=706552 RepID=A0AAW1PKE7_9CHLO